MNDRYLKIVLTVIALELFWIGARDMSVPVAAQAEATRVIVTGVDIGAGGAPRGALPVMVRASDAALRVQADSPEKPLRMEAVRPVTIQGDRPLAVSLDRPVKVEADTPLKVEQIPYTPGRIPGE